MASPYVLLRDGRFVVCFLSASEDEPLFFLRYITNCQHGSIQLVSVARCNSGQFCRANAFNCMSRSRADKTRVLREMQIVDLDSSSGISDELLAI